MFVIRFLPFRWHLCLVVHVCLLIWTYTTKPRLNQWSILVTVLRFDCKPFYILIYLFIICCSLVPHLQDFLLLVCLRESAHSPWTSGRRISSGLSSVWQRRSRSSCTPWVSRVLFLFMRYLPTERLRTTELATIFRRESTLQLTLSVRPIWQFFRLLLLGALFFPLQTCAV